MLRLATFNCENLYSRARVLASSEACRRAAALESLLGRRRRSAADQRHIEVEARALARQVEVEVEAGAPGRLVFHRTPTPAPQREAKARLLRSLKADVLALQEVDDQAALDDLNHQRLAGRCPHRLALPSPDRRGLALALMSRLPVAALRSHVATHLGHDGRLLFPRDCVHAEIALPGGKPLHLMLAHFDGPWDAPTSAHQPSRHQQQASALATWLRQRNLADERVVVMGDLGEPPQRAPQALAALLQLPGLNDALALQFPIPDDRWTTSLGPRNLQTSYLLLSDALMASFRGAGVERRGLPDLAEHTICGERPFPGVGAAATAASHHAAVWADFEL
ncbi:MAG: endonuclease/exonuclease/phosphatase family protein [Pseudomonadota bacterium]